jgi:DNA invertase Pin-like site-specific DNA recombinase
MIYGYCRISTPTQSIERQKRNILRLYPKAQLFCEAVSGTKLDGRKELDRLLKLVKEGDTIVFDSASRMSRNAEEATKLYTELFEKGIILEFLKEPHINTEVYKQARDNRIEINCDGMDASANKLVSSIINALNEYTLDLAAAQIKLCFEQAEKEVTDLHERTREGIETARLQGKQIGRPAGFRPVTKKSVQAKQVILQYSRDFGGPLKDKEVMKLAGVSKRYYYIYKKELKDERSKK